MAMKIRVTRLRGEGTASRELILQNPTATVGRNPDRDVFLDDSERVVSGQHALIESRGNEIWITDISRNGTFVNQSNEPLPPHQAVALAPSDRVLIGPFELRISLVDDTAPSPLPSRPPEDQEVSLPGLFGTGQAADILDLLGGGEQPRGVPGAGSQPRLRDQPFADAAALDSRLAGPARSAVPQSAPELTPVEHVCYRPPQPQVLPQTIPEGYDVLRDIWTGPGEPSPSPATTPPRSEVALGDDQRPSPAPPSPATPWDFSADASFPPAGHLAAPAAPPVPEPASAHGPTSTSTLDFGPASAPGPGSAPTTPLGPASGPAPTLAPSTPGSAAPNQPLPTLGSTPSTLAPGAQLAAGSGPPPAWDQAWDHTRGGEAALVAAFFQGLGLADRMDRMTLEHPEALMHQAGALLRELVAGLIGIMMGRAQFKSELRLGVTTIRPVENNPFKFAVDPGDLLERLLLRPSPGFMPPLAAAHEAFDDIRAHEMAMTAGLQAALRALLARFAPAELEHRLSGPSRLEHWLPMARKAHFWDLFTAAYAEVAADATEDFMQLFGDAFAAAYREQIDRLAGRREGAAAASRSDT